MTIINGTTKLLCKEDGDLHVFTNNKLQIVGFTFGYADHKQEKKTSFPMNLSSTTHWKKKSLHPFFHCYPNKNYNGLGLKYNNELYHFKTGCCVDCGRWFTDLKLHNYNLQKSINGSIVYDTNITNEILGAYPEPVKRVSWNDGNGNCNNNNHSCKCNNDNNIFLCCFKGPASDYNNLKTKNFTNENSVLAGLVPSKNGNENKK